MRSRNLWERFESERGVLLRRPTDSDVAGIFAVHGDPAVYQYDPQETHPDPDHTARFLAPMLDHWTTHGFGYWTVLIPRTAWNGGVPGGVSDDGDRVIAGMGGIQHHTVDGRPVLNVYFRFAPATQGNGLARTVIQHGIRIAPLVAPRTDLVVRTRPVNMIARHVAERAGFTDEGLEPGTTDMQLLTLTAPGRNEADVIES